jgi:hypothetical protein
VIGAAETAGGNIEGTRKEREKIPAKRNRNPFFIAIPP